MESASVLDMLWEYLKEKKIINELEQDILSTIETYMQIPFDRDKGENKIIENNVKHIDMPEIIKYDEKQTIIHVHIPPSAEIHSYKKIIYDRVGDADVKVTSTGTIVQMYIRKQNIFTEKKIYPYARMEDLRLDLLPKIRIMAKKSCWRTTSLDGNG